jgi:hypothetical protein
MSSNRKGGIVFLSINGKRYDAKGNVEYNLGSNKRDTVTGVDTVHGYAETPQPAMVSLNITDSGSLDVKSLIEIDDATVVLELANGKVVTFYEAWQVGENGISTEEGEISIQFDAKRAEEV